MMSPPKTALASLTVLIGVMLVLALIFPAVLAFVEMAARELRYLWWLVLLIALGLWLIWGVGHKPRP